MDNREYEQKRRECWEECAAKVAVETTNLLCKAIAYSAFDRAYALGKQEKDADAVIQGWVAQDRDGEIYLYEDEPKRGSDEWLGKLHPEFDFQEVRWSNDPIEVEIIIKRKKNG